MRLAEKLDWKGLKHSGKHTYHLLKQEEILHFGHKLYVISSFIQHVIHYLLKRFYLI
jgi:hypothetical protein